MMATATVLRRRSDVRFRVVAPEAVVIRQTVPEVLVLNAVAGRVLELCDGRTSLASLVDALVLECDVERAELERDVLGFAQELLEAQLVEEVGDAG